MPEAMEYGRHFLPGPTEVRPEVLAAQVRPMIGHRGEEMKRLIGRIQSRLKAVFRTRRPVYISTSSATGLMEAAVRNGARRRVLSLVNGAFSKRFQKIAVACGYEVDALDVAWGEVHSPDMLKDALRRGDYDAITVVHSETSTGALNPIDALAEVAHDAGDVVVLVDSVSGLAGAPVETDRWGLDFVLTGSQKALAVPPGLAFGVAQRRMLRRIDEERGRRGVYFDLREFERRIEDDQTPNTPAVSLLYALDAQLQRIDEEGIENRWARHEAMARRTWEWVDEMQERGVGLEIFAPEGHRSPTVTCVRVPDDMSGVTICMSLRQRGFAIAPGYGPTKEKFVRIGHMGDHTVDELDALLEAMEEVFGV